MLCRSMEGYLYHSDAVAGLICRQNGLPIVRAALSETKGAGRQRASSRTWRCRSPVRQVGSAASIGPARAFAWPTPLAMSSLRSS